MGMTKIKIKCHVDVVVEIILSLVECGSVMGLELHQQQHPHPFSILNL